MKKLQPAPKAPVFRRINSRRSFEEICDRIREQFEVGALRPGDKLPAERLLAGQLGVGRGALREALRALESAGILHLRKGATGGAFVRSGEPRHIAQSLQDMVSLGTISLEDLTEARLLILEVVVRLASQRATEIDFVALERNIELMERMTKEGNRDGRLGAATDFYKILATATRNQIFTFVVESLSAALRKSVEGEAGPIMGT